MKTYISNIENETQNNDNFRKVLFTGNHCQLVVMCLLPGEEIGMEVHPNVDQFFRVEAGVARFVVDGVESVLGPDFVAIIPAGAEHNVLNISAKEKLKMYTIYSPANHPVGTIHKTKQDAEQAERENHHSNPHK